MKRKLTIALLIVVLVLSLVTAVACGHKHNYTKWGSDDTNHWKYCPEDNEIDESSRAPHDFTNGNCVCGKEAPAPHVHSYTQWYKDDPVNHWKVCPADNAKDATSEGPHDYGTTGVCVCGRPEPLVEYDVEGVVVLRKLGTTTNSTDGVTLTLSDDEGELPTEITKEADGKFTFKANPGKYYLTATKDGYLEKSLTINVSKDVGDLTGDDALELAMEYDAFYAGVNDGTGNPSFTGAFGHPEHIDKSHVNDQNPYFIVNNGADDFYQYSNELYDDVAFGVTYKAGMGSDNLTIALTFEGRKAVMARVQKLNGSYKIQWVESGKIWMEDNIIGKWDIDGYTPISADLKAKYESEGIELKFIRRGGMVTLLVDGVEADTQNMPAEFADKQCRLTFIVPGVSGGGTEIHYNVSTDVAKTPVTVTNPTVEKGAIAVSGANIGDHFVLTINPDENCLPTSLLINNEERIKDIREGKLDLGVYTGETLAIDAVFAQYVNVDVNVAISGNYLGKTMDLSGQNVTLTNVMGEAQDVAVADGRLIARLPDGTYTITKDGYLPYEFAVPKYGEVEDVVLDYDSLESMPFVWYITSPDFAEMNNGSFTTGANGNSVAVKSKDTFSNVQITLNAHKGNGGKQGVWFLFPTANGYDAVSIIIKDTGAIEFDKGDWWSWDHSKITNVTNSAKHSNGWWLADDDGEGMYQTLSADEMTMYENGTFKLSVLRYGNYFYIYINGVYTGNWCVVDEAYAEAECYIGFVGTDTPTGKEWSYEVEEVESLPALNIKLPESVEHASITLAADSYKLGDQVTLNITLDENYVVDSLKVNGTEIKHRIKDDKVSFTPTSTEEVVVEITVIRVVYVNLDVAISGNKLGTSVDLSGNTVTLTDLFGKSMQLPIAEGKLSKNDFPAGTYTVTLDGYMPATLVVPEQEAAQAVVLNYELLEEMPFADWITTPDFAQMNDGKFTTGTNGNSVAVKSTDTYGNVQLTLNLHKGNGGKQGVWFLFPTDAGYDAVSITIKDSGAIEFDQTDWWGSNSHITNVTRSAKHSNGWWLADDEGNGMYQTLSAAEMAMFENGTLKLSVIRYGIYFYVYVNDVYTGNWCVVNEAYAEAKCYIGFVGTDTPNGKEWNYSIKDNATLPALNVKLPETVANGTIALAAPSYKLGDQVTLNLTVNENCFIVALRVNGKDIKHRIDNNAVKFTPTTTDVEVEYVVEEIKDVTLSKQIGARKYNQDVTLNGVDATLTNKADSAITYTLPIANGIMAGQVQTGVYTLSVQGYLSTDVVIVSSGIEEEVVLQFDAFYVGGPGWGSYDFSEQNNGKLVITDGCAWVYTKEKFDAVAFSMNLIPEGYTSGGRLGIALLFNGEHVTVRAEDRAKIQFSQDLGWGRDYVVNRAAGGGADGKGNDWNDLVFFSDNATLKKAFDDGTLKLTVVREGTTIYVFINDVYFGKNVIADTYADVKCEVGVFFEGVNGGAKTVTYAIENIETYRQLLQVTKTAENGTITVNGENNKVGDELSILIAANAGYKLTSVTVNGTDVTDQLVEGADGFTLTTIAKTQSLNIVATFDPVGSSEPTPVA